MSTLTLSIGRPTLADRLFTRGLAMDIALIAAGAGLTSIAAQITVAMWPVPITGQTFAVLLVGTTLGAVRGALSLALYLVLGVVGLPIFAGGTHGSLLDLSSGGFIIGFILAALITGWLAQLQWDRKIWKTLLSFAAGTLAIYLVGVPWLYVSLSDAGPSVYRDVLGYGSPLAAVFGAGVLPFLVGDAIKAIVAGALLPGTWKLVDRVDAKKDLGE